MGFDKPYRIAIRAEGPVINAYWARTGTMEGAEQVASINRELCDSEPKIFEGFQLLMKALSVELVRLRLGKTVDHIEVEPAPEHERAGRS